MPVPISSRRSTPVLNIPDMMNEILTTSQKALENWVIKMQDSKFFPVYWITGGNFVIDHMPNRNSMGIILPNAFFRHFDNIIRTTCNALQDNPVCWAPTGYPRVLIESQTVTGDAYKVTTLFLRYDALYSKATELQAAYYQAANKQKFKELQS